MVAGQTEAAQMLFQPFARCVGEYRYAQNLMLVDLSKAFDSMDRNMAWQILSSRGITPKLVALIKDLHTIWHWAVQTCHL